MRCHGDELMFAVQYEGSKDAKLVPPKLANIKFLQQVISHYEKITSWDNSDNTFTNIRPKCTYRMNFYIIDLNFSKVRSFIYRVSIKSYRLKKIKFHFSLLYD